MKCLSGMLPVDNTKKMGRVVGMKEIMPWHGSGMEVGLKMRP